jgi:hypothetical protein
MASPEPKVGRLFLAGGVRPTSNSTACVNKEVKGISSVKNRYVLKRNKQNFFMTGKGLQIDILN